MQHLSSKQFVQRWTIWTTPTTHPPRFNFDWNFRIDCKSTIIPLFLSLGGLLVIKAAPFQWILLKTLQLKSWTCVGAIWWWWWLILGVAEIFAWALLSEQTIASYPTQSQPIALHYCLLLFVCSSFVFEHRLVSSRICSPETNFLWASADWHFCSFGNVAILESWTAGWLLKPVSTS